jgi:hypothetical protein
MQYEITSGGIVLSWAGQDYQHEELETDRIADEQQAAAIPDDETVQVMRELSRQIEAMG